MMVISHPIFVDIGKGLSLMTGLPTIISWNTKQRPQNAKRGTFGFNSQTNNLEYFDGSDWFAASMSTAWFITREPKSVPVNTGADESDINNTSQASTKRNKPISRPEKPRAFSPRRFINFPLAF